jgi:hypothetical protein
MASVLLCLTIAWPFAGSAEEQAALPVVADVDFQDLSKQCRRLLDGMEALKGPLAPGKARALQALLKGGKDPETAAREIQKLLDPLCLVAVSINPESRVKAARGPGRAELVCNQENVVLVKIHNEAGVTHALKVSSPGGNSPGEGWLKPEVYAGPREAGGLSGQKVEYVLLRLSAREAGKREATLKFDVGQGTQDLGFRAEVPILFRVRSR